MSTASPTITSVQKFIEKITADPVPPGKVVVYRGHPDMEFVLKPAVFRSSIAKEREHLLLRDLIAAHPNEFVSDVSALEQLVRMQHYSLPTRLLDVTWNPMVALYFAAENFSKKKKLAALKKNGEPKEETVYPSGQVIRLTIDEDFIRYFDSDVISCLTNLARCKPAQKKEIRDLVAAGTPLTKFNAQTEVRRLLHFIRGEKPAFEPEIEPSQMEELYLVKPKLNNKRILAQEGAFIVFGLVDELPPLGVSAIKVDRFEIKYRYKARIINQLKALSINQRTLFPEIDRAARYLTDELSTDDLLSRGAGPTVGTSTASGSTRRKH